MITLEGASAATTDYPHVFCDMGEDIQHVCPLLLDALSPHKSRYRPSSRDAATTGGNAGPKDNPPDVTRFRSATAKRFNALPR